MADISFFENLALKSKLGFLRGESQRIIGLDIGSASVKLVQLKKEKERGILETYGELSIGPYLKKETGQIVSLTEDELVLIIKDLLKESGAKTNEIIVSVPLKSSFITTIDFPLMSDAELKEAVSFEARRHIPISLSEVEIDWWAMPKALETKKRVEEEGLFEKKEKVKVLLVAIHKEVIERFRAIASKAGLHIKGFEIEVFSLARASIMQELSPILLIDFGASSTKMAIVDYGVIRETLQFQRGSQEITLALSHSLNIDFPRAPKSIKRIGLSLKPEHQETASVIRPILDHILAEAERIIIDYRRREERSISHIALSGGGASLKGLADLVINNLGIEARLANPFKKTAYPLFLEPVLKDIGPSLAIATGLALRGLKEE